MVLACSSDSSRPTTAASTSTIAALSFELCTTRLDYSDALTDLDTPPFTDEEEAIATLRSMRPPNGLDTHWGDLLRVADEAARSHVKTEQIDDQELFDAGFQAIRSLDALVIASPCDPAGLPDNFGCIAIRSCADSLARGESKDHATGYVSQNMLGHNWNTVTCFDREYWKQQGVPEPDPGARPSLCTFEDKTADDRVLAHVSVKFASTRDGRFFAWTAEP
jgi:hypothetical protein